MKSAYGILVYMQDSFGAMFGILMRIISQDQMDKYIRSCEKRGGINAYNS